MKSLLPTLQVSDNPKTQRPPRPDRTVSLEAIYHHLPLSLVLPEISEYIFLLGIILSDPLQASLNEAFYVPLV
jgi:hypothetical protein